MKAPFPWFGGKSLAAPIIWDRFGDVDNYVEPFAGSLAVLLAAAHGGRIIETVNDLDGFVANFWRAVAADPESVWWHADWPVNEADLHARHIWLVNHRGDLTDRLMGDPDFFDARIAGWWVWGLSMWIGGQWCSGDGLWNTDGTRLVRNAGKGVTKQKPHLSDAGKGVTKQKPHLSELSERLQRVRVCCGDWSRVLTPSVTTRLGVTAVLLDPPYSSEADRAMNIYAVDSGSVAHDVRDWAIEHGTERLMRIALCGYDGEHDELIGHGWTVAEWTAVGGYSRGGRSATNRHRERVWFSPHCKTTTLKLF